MGKNQYVSMEMIEKTEITFMQTRLIRLASEEWHLPVEQIIHLFKEADVLGYIEKCYGIFHCEGDEAVLEKNAYPVGQQDRRWSQDHLVNSGGIHFGVGAFPITNVPHIPLVFNGKIKICSSSDRDLSLSLLYPQFLKCYYKNFNICNQQSGQLICKNGLAALFLQKMEVLQWQ